MDDRKIWTKESVIQLLNTSDRAVKEAIKALHARQTESEREGKATYLANGVGFNRNDAPFLSDIARKLPYYNDNMTPRQLARARQMLPKYWRQLLEIAAEKGYRVVMPDAPAIAGALQTARQTTNPLYGRF